MFDSVAGLGALLQAAAAPMPGLQDTLFTKQVDSGWFTRVAGIASGLMSIALLVLTVALVPAAWNLRKAYKRWNQLLERITGDAKPLAHHAAVVADNLDYITTALRADVHRVNATVTDANEALQAAVRQMERRVQAFSALLDVAQQESERAFVATAATVRGVRTSAAVLRDSLQSAIDPDALDAMEEEVVRGELAAGDMDDQETTHGYDDDDAPGSDPGPARPRVRRRPPL
ncbi:MAG TPA: DUF948 domain-containing protein [Gemmatimonadaceae bacterium]|nr:DUF948 domain-containing protein [Gemmatimonadaceae bacterium]